MSELIAGIAGAIVGAILQYFSTQINNHNEIKQLRKDFTNEVQSNLQEIERLRNVVDKLERKVNERDRTVFKENIRIKCVYWSFQYMVSRGKIYECINSEIYSLLDDVYRDLSQQGETNADNEFHSLESILYESPTIHNPSGYCSNNWSILKQQAQELFIKWRRILTEHKKNLEKIQTILQTL